jgi:NADPH-dependent curcumin reductase CurA
MRPAVSRQVVLKSRPSGIPQAGNFEIVTAPVPALRDDQVLVRNIYLGVEPAMRGWVSAAANYSEPVPIGGGTIQRKIAEDGLPASTALGVLGLNGFTAYFALLDVGQPKAGETVVVSTAAGAVGSCVGQIARIKGCRTVGIAGGAGKTRLCTGEFGYDAAIDYKAGGLDEALAQACPEGLDVYFDNTSGPISDAVMKHLRPGARMQGFLIFDYAHRYPEALAALTGWVREGKIRYREDILEGLEQAPGSIAGLYRGENLGKRIIRIAPENG